MSRQIQQYRMNVSNVGNTLVEAALDNVPVVGIVRKVRFEVTAGTDPSADVAGEVRQVTGGTGPDVVLAYSFTADPLESEESAFYSVLTGVVSGARGTLFVAVRVNNAAADHTVAVELTIEDLTGG